MNGYEYIMVLDLIDTTERQRRERLDGKDCDDSDRNIPCDGDGSGGSINDDAARGRCQWRRRLTHKRGRHTCGYNDGGVARTCHRVLP